MEELSEYAAAKGYEATQTESGELHLAKGVLTIRIVQKYFIGLPQPTYTVTVETKTDKGREKYQGRGVNAQGVRQRIDTPQRPKFFEEKNIPTINNRKPPTQ